MNETERKVYLEQFNRRTHVLGRAVCVITLVLLVGAPFLIGTFLGAMPDMGAVGKGFLSVGVVWAVASVAEFLIYTPMLGAGGGYLAFITGNLINMKIPCAVNARDIAGTKTGTAENETDKDHAWFVGYAPAENPQIAVAVLLEYDGGAGGTNAGPIAKNIIRKYLSAK